ncbi:MAG TPA: hypothetical protein VL285_03235 [Bryobacteraceae bacterium]|nr:hypothetical protein [Bryobacteraceae bacterium]
MEVNVDGQTYKTPVTLLWPAGSSHTLRTYSQLDVTGSTQWQVNGFVTNRGACPDPCVATADPDITEINANVSIAYQVRVVFAVCGSDSPGTVSLSGNAFACTGSFYAAKGSLSLQASPNPGWVFVGWYSGLGNDSQAFQNSATVTGPLSIYPKFVRARTITVQSVPSGLQVLADRSPVTTPASLNWGAGTTHTLGSMPDQIDNHGKLWVFDSWNDGGAINHAYVVGELQGSLSVTANYVAGQRVSFLTSPPGLTLTVDGRSNWLSNNFAWAVNSLHTVSAPLTQTDAEGNTYVFKSWSQGGAAAQTIVAGQTLDNNGLPIDLRYTAVYEGQSRISIGSQVPGVVIQVDGEDCALPCVIEKPNGSRIRLTAPASLKLTEDSRLDFQGWGDSGEGDRTLTAIPGPQSLSLNYKLRNRLNITITPPEGARLSMEPSTADGYYDAQSQVQVTIETKLGFKFQNWEGDMTSNSRTLTIGMTSPRFIRAVLDRVPALQDRAVRNAAGDTPLDAVAAGSIVSIFGVNLAQEYQAGPTSPLRQTLGGVTVNMNGKILPLVFVSPEQINAQLPSDLADGVYTLTVQSGGKPDVSAEFKVARNAPGLFNKVIDGQAFGLFFHENGDPVAVDSRARRGETVTLLGTGLGPFLQMPPEGFGVQESAGFALSDAVTILSGDSAFEPSYAGIASGRVGMAAIRFKIDDRLPAGANAEIKIRVRDGESNTVLLPLE